MQKPIRNFLAIAVSTLFLTTVVSANDPAHDAARIFCIILRPDLIAPVAQLDRVPGYEPGGREFESLRARHFSITYSCFKLVAVQ